MPGKRRGDPLDTDRPTNVASSPSPQHRKGTTPVPTALATVYLVHTTRGGLRALLLVDCPLPGCGHVHQHRAPVDFTSGRRKAGCGGAYVVHAGAVESGCAA
jgi:hypothetical protein